MSQLNKANTSIRSTGTKKAFSKTEWPPIHLAA
jgi:hypothetical protein